eukprot:204277_1
MIAQLNRAKRRVIGNTFNNILDKPEYFFALGSIPLINLLLTKFRHFFGTYYFAWDLACFLFWIIKFLFYPQKKYRYAWIYCISTELICILFFYASFIIQICVSSKINNFEFSFIDPFLFIWLSEAWLMWCGYYLEIWYEIQGLCKYFRINHGKHCSICYENWEDTPNESILFLWCGHIFHAKCWNKWDTNANAVCAICRYDPQHIYAWKLHPYQCAILQFFIDRKFGYHASQLYVMFKSNSIWLLNRIKHINVSNPTPININVSQQQQPLQYPIHNQNNNNNNINENNNSNGIDDLIEHNIDNRVKRKKKRVKKRNKSRKKIKQKHSDSISLVNQNNNVNNNINNQLGMDDEKICNDVLQLDRSEYKSNNNNISFRNMYNKNIISKHKKKQYNKPLLPLHNQTNALKKKPLFDNKQMEKEEQKQLYTYSSDSSSNSEYINETKTGNKIEQNNMIQQDEKSNNYMNNNDELLYSSSESLSDVIIENTKTTPGGYNPLKKEKKRCDKCTFDNDISAQICEICNNSFVNINNKKKKRIKYWKCNSCGMKNKNMILLCICGKHKPMKEWEWNCNNCTSINHINNIKCKVCKQKRIIDNNEWQCMSCYKYNTLNNSKCNRCYKPRMSINVLPKKKKKKNKHKKILNNVENKLECIDKKKENKICKPLYLRDINVAPPPHRVAPVIPKKIYLKSNGISDRYESYDTQRDYNMYNQYDYDYSEEDDQYNQYNQYNNGYNQYKSYNTNNEYNQQR